MLTRRTLFVLLAIAATFTADRHADAGRFCDWLFGRTQTPVVAGYPPYAAGYTPYAAGYAPYAAGYAPATTGQVVLPTQGVSASLATGPAAVATTNGAYQAQRPSYDNPSVYTGMPVIMAPGPTRSSYRLPATTYLPQTSAQVAPFNQAPLTQVAPVSQVTMPTVSAYRPLAEGFQQSNTVPLARVLRGGAAATSNPFYGTGNVYPNSYQTRYQAAYPVTNLAGPAAGPAVGAANVMPLFPNSPPVQPRLGGLARFFGSLWGTNYRSSYYRAPITYYRPVTSVNPVTGTTVTVQQPCTSSVQQLQRTPYNSLLTQGAVAPAMGSSCGGSDCSSPSPNPYMGPNVTTMPPSAYGGANAYGGVGQASGIASPSDMNVTPIPSVEPSYQPQPGYQPQPSYQPQPGYLQPPGSAPNSQPLRGNAPSGNGGDFQQIPQPQLQSARPAIEETQQPKPQADSYWQDRDREDLEREDRTATQSLKPQSLKPLGNAFSNIRPIEAPQDYVSPFTRRQPAVQTFKSPAAKGEFTAPPLLPEPANDTFDLRGATSASLQMTVPVREATLTKARRVTTPQPRVRDSGGWQSND